MNRDAKSRLFYWAFGGAIANALLIALWLYSGRDHYAVVVTVGLFAFVGLPCIGLLLGWCFRNRRPNAKSDSN